MNLPVYLYGHPVLREIADDVTPDYPGLKTLIADMFETMYTSEGVGLAAPQIGKSIRLVVIDADPVAESFPDCAGKKWYSSTPKSKCSTATKSTAPKDASASPDSQRT